MSPGAPKMEAKALPGTPWEGEISLGNSSGGPPEDTNEFFFGPGGLQERLWSYLSCSPHLACLPGSRAQMRTNAGLGRELPGAS